MPDAEHVPKATNSTITYYQISTLNSFPRLCLHVDSSSIPSKDPPVNQPTSQCLNFPRDWFDGTNGCIGYFQHAASRDEVGWCVDFGATKYGTVPTTAQEGCCACGGGDRDLHRLRFKVGDEVLYQPSLGGLKPTSPQRGDKLVKAKVINAGDYKLPPGVAYEIETTEDSSTSIGNGYVRITRAGVTAFVHGDTDEYIAAPKRKRDLVELRKCIEGGGGALNQLFALERKGGFGGGEFTITHLTTGLRVSHYPPEMIDDDDDDDDDDFFSFMGSSNTREFNKVDTVQFPDEIVDGKEDGEIGDEFDGLFDDNDDEEGSSDTQSIVQALSLVPVFEGKHVFRGSADYFYISVGNKTASATENPVTGGGSGNACLISGSFGGKEYENPLWAKTCTDDEDRTHFSMWTLRGVEVTIGDDGVPVVAAEETVGDVHANWLSNVALSTPAGIERLRQIAPWSLLDVERGADEKVIKDRFRELSRKFHPDKRRPGDGSSEAERERTGELFMLLQSAYDGLKNKNEREKEKFRLDAEVEEQLFTRSTSVVELLPSMWKQLGVSGDEDGEDTVDVDGGGRWVISLGVGVEETPDEPRAGEDTEDLVDAKPNVRGWLLFLYSPRCGMSRAVAAMLDLTASHLAKDGIMVGAYGCGVYGQSKASSKKKGFVGWMDDPVCKQFGRKETPNTHFVMEVTGTDVDPMTVKRAQEFTNFYAKGATATPKDLWPDRLINFAKLSQKAWEDGALVESFTEESFASPDFSEKFRVVAFLDSTATEELREIQDAMVVAIPGVAKRITRAGGRVGIATCATGSETEEKAKYVVDCSKLGVAWLPDVKFYGANRTKGDSVLAEQYEERRDIQITLEVMANTVISIMGLEREDESIVDDMDNDEDLEVGDDEQSCFKSPDPQQNPPANDGPELGSPEEKMRLEGGETKEPKVKLSNQPAKPMLDESARKPKLASGSGRGGSGVRLDASKASTRTLGGGTIFGGSGSGGFGGAIGA